MKKILPDAGDCSKHLAKHIDYVCEASAAGGLTPVIDGVLA
jgi:hypothetical protein